MNYVMSVVNGKAYIRNKHCDGENKLLNIEVADIPKLIEALGRIYELDLLEFIDINEETSVGKIRQYTQGQTEHVAAIHFQKSTRWISFGRLPFFIEFLKEKLTKAESGDNFYM